MLNKVVKAFMSGLALAVIIIVPWIVYESAVLAFTNGMGLLSVLILSMFVLSVFLLINEMEK